MITWTSSIIAGTSTSSFDTYTMMWSFPIPIPVTPGRSVSSSPCAYLIFAM
ncbi:MAG TPA: hypothetical protein VLU99_06110 [Nitrososphaerales archaeon]|nr:hypothetical protein [Nitrososphaerales archaeon]